MIKFNRNFKLTILDAEKPSSYYEPDLTNNSNLRLKPANKDVVNDKALIKSGRDELIIEPPFTIEINVVNVIEINGNTASIKIYGLNETNRKKLFQNKFNIPRIEGTEINFKKVILEAGYGRNIYPIFKGVIMWGYSVREGVDWVTYLECQSSGIGLYNTFINQSYGAGIKQIEVVRDIIRQMSKYGDLEEGAITTTLDESYAEGVSLIGESYNLLTQFGTDVFVDMEKLNVLQVDEVIGQITTQKLSLIHGLFEKLGLQTNVIDADSGLIGTPIFGQDGYITVNIIFDPTIKLASLISLKSSTSSGFDGDYKVRGIIHRGVISSSREGMLITTLKMWTGGSALDRFRIISQ